MKFSFHPSAKMELNEAIDYYKRFQAGLGTQFSNEAYSAIKRIIRLPEAWTRMSEKPEDVKLTDFLMVSYTKLPITKL